MDLSTDGYEILPAVASSDLCHEIANEVSSALTVQTGAAIESTHGKVVGARNLFDHWTGWRRISDHPMVADLIREQVSTTAGLVRILYFDKPPGQSWSLSLHRDKTIAVAQHQFPALPFSRPTTKAGVPHVVAAENLLQSMLTLRLHLDPMTAQNGPLVVVPGSHRELAAEPSSDSFAIHCNAGDVFVMRPLLLHGSCAADPETQLHRRVVHLEIAPAETLPGQYRWHRFARLGRTKS